MRRWEKALLAVDRVLGTGEPPSRAELAAARHPVRVGVTSGTAMAVGFAATLSGFDDPVILFQATLLGAGLGLILWAACRNARWLHAHYVRTGRYEEVRQKALRAKPLSRRAVILQMLGAWAVTSGMFWLIAPYKDLPRGWLWSPAFGAALLAFVYAAASLKQKRSRRRFFVATAANLDDQAVAVTTREDFVVFLAAALADLRDRPEEWENRTLGNFLEAWGAWVGDMPGWYANRGEVVPEQPDWHLLAAMVMAARIYE
ncbi:hypothetical protein OG613_15015 [Streptomyces sp. NBC_00015]|uniref:DUF7660 family protein n=1 Tax=unclassified Streptomyces TaxID=2593676 RepID=UPI0022575092|nr:hypothetical protein [Streptomyces sp. NBC_00103]MCX5370294.1 hypothetical protein [Streptomyces sp. NBC_00103]